MAKYRLRKPEVTRVDIVDVGANQESFIRLAKRGDPKKRKRGRAASTIYSGYQKNLTQGYGPQDEGMPAGGPEDGPSAPPSAKPQPRLMRFHPQDFEAVDQGNNYREWKLVEESLPEGFEEITLTMFRDGEEVRYQWMVDPVDGPPLAGSEKTAADALMALREAATSGTAMFGSQMKMPGLDPAAGGKPTGMGGGMEGPRRAQPAKAALKKIAEAKKAAEGSRLEYMLSTMAKGLVDAEVFIDTATGNDLRDILPPETLDQLSSLMSTPLSAEVAKEANVPDNSDLEGILADLPAEVVEYISGLEAELEELTASVAKAHFVAEETDPIAKALNGLPEEAVAIFKSQQERLAKAESALAQEQLRKADAEYITKARAFDGVIDKPEEFGPALRAFAQDHAEQAEMLENALRAANERLAKGALFMEFGHGGPAPGSAEDQAVALAKNLQTADPSLSEIEAKAKVWEANPDLYARYVQEQRERAKSL